MNDKFFINIDDSMAENENFTTEIELQNVYKSCLLIFGKNM